MKRFALTGAAGYIAPSHMKAIKDTGNVLKAALDPNDSVGIIDSYFPDANFFTESVRFDRHIDRLRGTNESIDFLSICSPSYMHDAHCRVGLRSGCDIICEKPLVLNPWNIDALEKIEEETGKRIYNILQLRLHPSIVALKKSVEGASHEKVYEVHLNYISSRGNWYHNSWKGDQSKSGGIITNIGIHFFDMLIWIFGNVVDCQLEFNNDKKAKGFLTLDRAKVSWFLSIDFSDLPDKIKESGLRTFRNISVEGDEIEFSQGFTDLHTLSYRNILNGGGFRTSDVRKAIEIVSKIRK